MYLRATMAVLLICLATPSRAAPAQGTEKPLTNTDVANMLKAGLSEGTIIFAIQVASERGSTDFDSSPQALIELKKMGATENVLNAVLYAQTLPPRYVPSKRVPGLPEQAGLYYQAPAGWTVLHGALLWPEIRTAWKGTTASEHRRYVLAGREARLRIAERRPTFYLREPHPEHEWGLLRLTTKNDSRELRTMIPDAFALLRSMEFEAGERIELESTAVAEDVLRLRPAAELAPGEYLLFKWVPGQRWLVVGYAFGVGAT
jgi:hypothetical protein